MSNLSNVREIFKPFVIGYGKQLNRAVCEFDGRTKFRYDKGKDSIF